jgi:hypothetical protein
MAVWDKANFDMCALHTKHIKVNCRLIVDPTVNNKTIQLPEEWKRTILSLSRVGNDFLDRRSKVLL